MGMNKVNIANALFSKTQQKVLGLLFANPEGNFYTNEIIRLTNIGSGAVQRELGKLTAAELVKKTQSGNQRCYQANQDSPIFAELQSMIAKTCGLADILRLALEPIHESILIAFVYGSVAQQQDTAMSDIDIMVISEELTYADLFQLLEGPELKLGRKINPTFYSPEAWRNKCNVENNFIKKVLSQSKIFLVGTEDELREIK